MRAIAGRVGRITGLALMTATAAVSAQSTDTSAGPDRMSLRPTILVEPLESETVILRTGEQVQLDWETTWRPICGSRPMDMTEFVELVDMSKAALQGQPQQSAPAVRGGTFDIQFNVVGSIPAGATAGLALAEAYLEQQFRDPVAVIVDVSFGATQPGVLGAASNVSANQGYSTLRSLLITDKDEDDTIQDHLPAGSTLPVRLNAATTTVTNVSTIRLTRVNFNALNGNTDANTGSIIFSNGVNWDYDPSNGVSATSFVDVVIHEVCHTMGFLSGVDDGTTRIADFYRFQRTDGTGDYNPDTLAEFTARPRLMDFDGPNDQHNTDIITAEYRMSDGNPSQASHFREQFPPIGIMDPGLAPGQTLFPNYMRTSDIAVLDAIGFDAGDIPVPPAGPMELRIVASDDMGTSSADADITLAAGETNVELYVQARVNDDDEATGVTTFDGVLTDDSTGTFAPELLTIQEATGLPFPGDDIDGRTGMFQTYRGTIGGNNADTGNGAQFGAEWRFLPLNVEAGGNGEGLNGSFSNVYKFTWSTADPTARTVQLQVNALLGGYQSTIGLRETSIIADTIEITIPASGCPCELTGSPPVDVLDLLAFLSLWFPTNGSMVPPGTGADLDASGTVDVLDLLSFLACWFPASSGGPCP